METLEAVYRLPVTVVTIAGTRTGVDNPILTPRRTTTRMAQIGIEIVADPDSSRKIQVDPAIWAKRSVSVSLNADGRLHAVNSMYEDQSGTRLASALRIGATVFGTMAPLGSSFMGPAGLALAAVAGLAGGAMTHAGTGAFRVAEHLVAVADPRSHAAIERPDPTELGVDRRYVIAHPAEANLLADLRFSRALLIVHRGQCTFRSAGMDAATLGRELRHVNQALESLRPGLEEAEAHYASWVNDQSSTTFVDQFHRTFTLDQLPSDEELHTAAADNFRPVGSSQRPGWQRLFENLRVAVSVELLDPIADRQGASEPDRENSADPRRTLTYRRARLARISQWKIEVGENQKYRLARQLVETKVVVLPGSEHYLPLLLQDGKRTMTVAFDADGLLAEVAIEHTDSRVTRAEQLKDLPGLVAGAVESGGRVAKGLERALPSATDPLEQLRAELEDTELRARLGRARVLVSDPTRNLTLFYDDAQAEESG